MKLLIADDSSLLRETLRKLIEGVETVTDIQETDSVATTIYYLERELPDVLILDIQMTDGTGYDVVRYLNDAPRRPTVIFLTNYATEQNRRRSVEMGVPYFFDKTNEYERVVELLENL